MSSATHYTTLGLLPTAAPEVIRAAYKALALLCHPDKTIQLTASERASHAVAFSEVQSAYDVLGNPSLRAAYDAKLSLRTNNCSLSPSLSQCSTGSEGPSTPRRRATVKITTPEEKTAMRAKARQSLDLLRQKRAERDAHDAQVDITDLKDSVRHWNQLAEENRSDPAMHAHCAIRVHEYEQKIAERQREHEDWLANMATAKRNTTMTPCSGRRQTTQAASKNPTPSRSTGSVLSSSASHSAGSRPRTKTSPTPRPFLAQPPFVARTEKTKLAEARRVAAAAAARADAYLAEKARLDAAKQAVTDKKAAAYRAEKDEQKAKVALRAREAAARIAKARAKAGTVGTMVNGHLVGGSSVFPIVANRTMLSPEKTKAKKICDKCDAVHASFRDWRICNAQSEPTSDHDDGKFFCLA